VHQYDGTGFEPKVDASFSKSSQEPIPKDSNQIIQNVQQHGDNNLNFKQASNFRIGDDYYQSGAPQK